MSVLGIDPGLKGGLALLSPRGEVERLWDMPSYATGKGLRREYDLRACWDLARALGPELELIAVERLQVTPKITKHTALGLGRAAMLWEMVAVALGVPLERITPKRWQAGVGAEKGEPAALARARELFPHAELPLAKHSGRAAALLIAEYARRLLAGAAALLLLGLALPAAAQQPLPCSDGSPRPITVRWRAGDPGGGVTGWRLFRREGNGAYLAPIELAPVTPPPADVLSAPAALDPTVTWQIALAAYGPGGQGAFSNELTVAASARNCAPPGRPELLEVLRLIQAAGDALREALDGGERR